MGGEKCLRAWPSALHTGSPPHRRGKDGKFIHINESTGIIPAWAGKRRPTLRASPLVWDHPRVGGEKPFLFYGGSSDSGSPPHGRGKSFFDAAYDLDVGITPALAGKR